MPRFALTALLSVTVLTGCAPDRKVKEKRTVYDRLGPVGFLMEYALSSERRNPAAAVGKYLDAASVAAAILHKDPRNTQALYDYNFAVSRVFGVLHDAKLDPWTKPLRVSGVSGEWTLAHRADSRPEYHPSRYHILPADRYTFSSTALKQRTIKPGLGAALVVTNEGHEDDPTKRDQFAPGKQIFAASTAVLRFEGPGGRNAVVSFEDPLAVEDVTFQGRKYPLGADFTMPIALALSRNNPTKLEIARTFRPYQYAETARLARLQQYDPKKIPILVVHGIMSSQATWVPLINTLRGDPEIRKHYQFWYYSYPTGYPYPQSAAILRKQLDAIGRRYPGHKKMVVIGHSMGGIISRTLLTDSGMQLWNSLFKVSPDEAQLSPTAREMITSATIFKPRRDLNRVIFVAAPHRGSELASGWLGRLGASFIRMPRTMLSMAGEVFSIMTFDVAGTRRNRIPTGVDTLSPTNPFVIAINKIPVVKGVPYHSIIGDRGKGGSKDRTPPVSSDGIVPYWSSHLDGAVSECIVPANHSAHAHPAGIAEIHRILLEHLKK